MSPATVRPSRPLDLLFATTAIAAALSGCGGGGGDAGNGVPPAASPPPPATASISGTVVDGPLQGATACYDLNDNRACDSGEPVSSATGADGAFTLTVDASVAGQHAVVVNVPATAVDADTSAAIGVAMSFVAPASGGSGSQAVFVSPLTTMVADQMQATGASAADAAALIQAQAGLAVSPLTDFRGTTPELQQAALLARLAVQTQKNLLAQMAPSLGQPDASGGTVSQADIDTAARNALRAALPALAATAASPAITGATDLAAALAAAAADLVATQPALDPAQALSAVAAAKLAQEASAPQAGASLRMLRWTDANTWSYRVMASNAQDATPDAASLVRFYDLRREAVAGVVTSWSFGGTPARQGDLHWNGSAWRDCPIGFRSTQTPRDAQGRTVYDYCDGWEKGVSVRTASDIGGQPIADVVASRIRAFPGEDSGSSYAQWGPADLASLGNASFAPGSQLLYQQTTPTETAIAYDVTSPAQIWDTSVAAGGDSRNNNTLPCRSAFLAGTGQRQAATLENLVVANPGTPCTVDPASDASGTSLNPNIWWSGTSLSLGSVPDGTTRPDGTSLYFTTTANLRVAFTGANQAVTYYSCHVRTNGGGVRNCAAIGTGTYAIQTLGDARVMTFQNLPAIAQRVGFARLYVERGGVVYLGYRNPVNVTRSTLRLNLAATNAVFGALGLGSFTP